MDSKGKIIRLGDRVTLGGGVDGVVVFSIDTGEFSPSFPRDEWEYLGLGIMVQTKQTGLVHIEENDGEVEVLD